jgi:endo-alpha-1,4-polygalactosaminidase (GH114 family)
VKEIKKKEKDSQNQLKIITNEGKKRVRKPKLNKENENIEKNIAEEDVFEEIDYNPFVKNLVTCVQKIIKTMLIPAVLDIL